MRDLPLLLLLVGCTGSADRPTRPDFRAAPTVDMKVTAIEFMPDEELASRLADVAEAGLTDPEPRVRDQVVLRLRNWGDDRALEPILAIYRQDEHHEVARAALGALRDLCSVRFGAPRPLDPPEGEVPPTCTPVYDGSARLPPLRPTPRVDAAAFWQAEGVATRTLANGEVWPEDESERLRVFAKYADPDIVKKRKRWP